jgi:hypothetical protein
LRPSRGTVPGPSRSRTSIQPRGCRGGSPSRRAISRSRSRQSELHSAARACSLARSCLRTGSGARRCPWRHDRAVAFATNVSQERASKALGAPSNSARAARSNRRASPRWGMAASLTKSVVCVAVPANSGTGGAFVYHVENYRRSRCTLSRGRAHGRNRLTCLMLQPSPRQPPSERTAAGHRDMVPER